MKYLLLVILFLYMKNIATTPALPCSDVRGSFVMQKLGPGYYVPELARKSKFIYFIVFPLYRLCYGCQNSFKNVIQRAAQALDLSSFSTIQNNNRTPVQWGLVPIPDINPSWLTLILRPPKCTTANQQQATVVAPPRETTVLFRHRCIDRQRKFFTRFGV